MGDDLAEKDQLADATMLEIYLRDVTIEHVEEIVEP